jgi:hypothetical protein
MSDKLRWLFNKVYKLLTNSSLSLQALIQTGNLSPWKQNVPNLLIISNHYTKFQSLSVWGVFGNGLAFFFIMVYLLLTKLCIIDFTVICREISMFHFRYLLWNFLQFLSFKLQCLRSTANSKKKYKYPEPDVKVLPHHAHVKKSTKTIFFQKIIVKPFLDRF